MSSYTMTNNLHTARLPISVTIICHNEVERIKETIECVEDWVDEVIVVDSGSTDGTQDIVLSTTAKLFFNEWQGYGQQKRFAEDQASNDWIFNIDADERVLPELAEEIQNRFIVESNNVEAYKVPIYDRFLCTREISKYKPYNPVRLYKKSVGRYRDSAVHDRVVLPNTANVSQLRNRIAHDSLKSFRHRVEKMNNYTDAQVIDLRSKGRKFSKMRIVLEFWCAFLVCYIRRGYWRNGFMGYIYSMNFAYSRFLRAIKLYESSSNE